MSSDLKQAAEKATEQFELWHMDMAKEILSGLTDREKDALRAALAAIPAPAPAQEPVAWIPPEREGAYVSGDSVQAYRTEKAGWEPVFKRPPAPVAASVPEGWKLVPTEPTPEMVRAAEKAETLHMVEDRKRGGKDQQLGWGHAYRAMLAAAPAAPGASPAPAAMVEPSREPSAWINERQDVLLNNPECYGREDERWTPLFAAPAAPVPLSDEQINHIWDNLTPEGHGKSRYTIIREAITEFCRVNGIGIKGGE